LGQEQKTHLAVGIVFGSYRIYYTTGVISFLAFMRGTPSLKFLFNIMNSLKYVKFFSGDFGLVFFA
jgi:hypothetical protein